MVWQPIVSHYIQGISTSDYGRKKRMEEERDRAIELLCSIKNEKLMKYIVSFISEAIKLWG